MKIKNPNRSIREPADSLVAYQQQLQGIFNLKWYLFVGYFCRCKQRGI